MARVRWDGGTAYEMVLDGRCDTSPDVVYDTLADLSTHLDWGGRRQRRGFRLTTLDPMAPVWVGASFTSQGTMPMTTAHWDDHSVVFAARPGEVLEFHTDSVARWPRGRKTAARWEHRYEIAPSGAGSHVTYRPRLAAITDPPLRMRAPPMKTMTCRVMIPFLCQRGFANLLRAAQRARVSGSVGQC